MEDISCTNRIIGFMLILDSKHTLGSVFLERRNVHLYFCFAA